MRTLVLAALVAAALSPSAPRAQVAVDVRVGFPAPPQLVVVQPGIQVVPDYDEEVFFSNGWYWLRRDESWYRTRDYRGGWVMVPRRAVPVALYRMPPGHYKHWRRDEMREAKWDAKQDRKYWKQQAKAEKHQGHGHGNGHGRGHDRD